MSTRSKQLPGHWSLSRQHQVVYLALGSALGIGNLVLLPPLMAHYGIVSVFFLHFFMLLIFSLPLMLAEMMWSRWLFRPLKESFKVFGFFGKLIWPLIVLAWIDITPIYTIELGRLTTDLFRTWVAVPKFLEKAITHSPALVESLIYYGVSMVLLVLALGLCVFPKHRLAAWFRNLGIMVLGGAILLVAAVLTTTTWKAANITGLLNLEFHRFDATAILEIFTYSLFTLSTGLGIHYTFIFYGSQKATSPRSKEAYWKTPGSLLRLATLVVIGDLLFSLLAFFLLVAFLGSGLSQTWQAAQSSSHFFAVSGFPSFILEMNQGILFYAIYVFVLLVSGFMALVSLLDVALFTIDQELRMKRWKSAVLLGFLLGLLSAAPLLPIVRDWVSDFGSAFLLPIVALLWSLAAGWAMPRRAQASLIGQGPVLDGTLQLWRFVVRWLLPTVLVILLAYRAAGS
jgi:SNF family Na+-dependent transporter